ncbi:MAG: hypothetical protein ACM3KR_04815 [Deltaproteobacteria bacterium]
MALKTKKRTTAYYLKRCIESMPVSGKDVCPWCRVEPSAIIACYAKNGTTLFLKKCSTCGSFIKIYRRSSDI